MKTQLNTRIQNSLDKGVHLTPITGIGPVNTNPNCNHFTQLAFQFNVLQAVTALHLGEVNEN